MVGSDDKTGTIAVNVRLSPEIDSMVVELIKAGKHTTKSDVLKTALMEYLFRQRVMDKFHDNLVNGMDDPEFREKIRDIIREYFSNMVKV